MSEPTTPAPNAKRKPSRKDTIIGGVVLVVVALGIAAACSGEDEEPIAAPAPAPAVTAEPSPSSEPTPEPTPVTPSSCLQALDLADDVIAANSEAFGVVGEMFEAASRFDIDDMTASQEELAEMADDVAPLATRYRTVRDQCRAAS